MAVGAGGRDLSTARGVRAAGSHGRGWHVPRAGGIDDVLQHERIPSGWLRNVEAAQHLGLQLCLSGRLGGLGGSQLRDRAVRGTRSSRGSAVRPHVVDARVRILFFMSHPGQARNFEWMLRGMAERGHQVHMAFDKVEKKNLPGLSDLADTLVEEYPAITSGEHPQPAKADWSWVSSRMRASLDFMRYLEPEFEDAPKL